MSSNSTAFISEEKRKYLLSTEGKREAALEESERLRIQGFHIKEALGGHVIHPSLFNKLPLFQKVLDVGCGDGLWLEELRSNPISSIPESSITHAVDLKDPNLDLPNSINAFTTHDINQPIPSKGLDSKKLENQEEGITIGEHGTYDFVHSRLLVVGIDHDRWVNVVKNMAEVLKPGGYLQMTEVNGVIQSRPSWFSDPDPIVVKMNRYLGTVSKAFNKDFAIGAHLRSHLVEAGLKNVKMISNVYPVGKVAEDFFGAEKRDNGISHQILAVRSCKDPFLALGGDPSIGITTGEEFDEFVKEFQTYAEEVGYFTTFSQAIGQK